jgi:hypothetical protein
MQQHTNLTAALVGYALTLGLFTSLSQAGPAPEPQNTVHPGQAAVEVAAGQWRGVLDDEYHALQQYQVAMAIFADYRFYGRVLDQHANPVAHARVTYEATHGFLSSGDGMGAVHTDDQGYFEIDTNGEALVLAAIIHPDIEYSYPPRALAGSDIDRTGHPMIRDSMGFRQTDKDPRYGDARKHQSKETAFVVHAWRKAGYAGAMGGQVDGFFARDGSVHTLRFTPDRRVKKIVKGSVDGHLRVSCTRQYMQNKSDVGDWAITMTAVGQGGLLETDDLFMNQAPDTGYQPSVSIDMQHGHADYHSSLLNKRYFFSANNGKEYGSLYVHFSPHLKWWDDQPCVAHISYKINPAGSRNLELNDR